MSGRTTTKSQRIDLRASEGQASVLRQAASLTETTMTDFILESAVERAEKVVADRRWFVADQAQWDEFQRLLGEPLPSTAKFERLASRPSPFLA
ncbi:MAG TPA: DUF1778 domain-containing protein [Propionibacteriaceae bacterium]